MLLASITLALGVGLLTRLHFDTPMQYVLGYQVPGGIGLGLALQQTVLAAQTILPIPDVPIGVSLIVLAQTLGGTVSLSIAETIFSTSLVSSIARSVPQVDQSTVLNSGATTLQKSIPAEYLDAVLFHYNRAIVETWYLSLAFACASIIGVLGMEWKRINPAQTPEAEPGLSDRPRLQDPEHRDLESEDNTLPPDESRFVDVEKV